MVRCVTVCVCIYKKGSVDLGYHTIYFTYLLATVSVVRIKDVSQAKNKCSSLRWIFFFFFFFFFLKKTVKHVKLASTTHFCPIPRTVFGVPPLADRLTGYPAGRCARILPPRVNSRRFLILRKSAVPVIWMTHVVSPVIFSPSTLPLSPSPAQSLPVHLPSCPRHPELVPMSRRRYSNPWPARPRP